MLHMHNNNKSVSLGVGCVMMEMSSFQTRFKQSHLLEILFHGHAGHHHYYYLSTSLKEKEKEIEKKKGKKQDIREDGNLCGEREREREPTRECVSRRPTVCLCVRVHIQEISFSCIYIYTV